MAKDANAQLHLLATENTDRCKFGAAIIAAKMLTIVHDVMPLKVDWDFVRTIFTDFEEFNLHKDEASYVNAVFKYLEIPGELYFPDNYFESLDIISEKCSNYRVSEVEVCVLKQAFSACMSGIAFCLQYNKGMQSTINVTVPDLKQLYKCDDLQKTLKRFSDTAIAFFGYHKCGFTKVSLLHIENQRYWLTLEF